MKDSNPPIGELFSRLYIERGAPSPDSRAFRNRLEAYLSENHRDDYPKLANFMKLEAGLAVQIIANYGVYYNFPKFFAEASIEEILNTITLIARFLESTYGPIQPNRPAPNTRLTKWHYFVARALREENLGYTLDAKCGVHFFVDEEFERNRVSALAAASGSRYAAVRDAFEKAHLYLDATPPDTKGAVRSAFEALEILAKLMSPGSTRLTADLVKKTLTPLVQSLSAEQTERLVLEKAMLATADLVDGVHFYRHGQGTQDPIAPSVPLAVHVLSSSASALRLWLEADAKSQSSVRK